MRLDSIREHLQPYSILGRRKTTINHAFASALAPHDEFNTARVAQAVRDLGQDPEADLICAYCGVRAAETWDHVFGLVRNQQYAGYGHTLGNLLPCCKSCNSAKGNKSWREYLEIVEPDLALRKHRTNILQNYFDRYLDARLDYNEMLSICPNELEQLERLRQQVFVLMQQADDIASTIRGKVRAHAQEEWPGISR
jgi:5-methylcytosine-specific restriction endonuclease McrA